MKKTKPDILRQLISLVLLIVICHPSIKAQTPQSRTLAEAFFGHEALFFQLVVKKKFTDTSRFNQGNHKIKKITPVVHAWGGYQNFQNLK